jgi:hypothetical protein
MSNWNVKAVGVGGAAAGIAVVAAALALAFGCLYAVEGALAGGAASGGESEIVAVRE